LEAFARFRHDLNFGQTKDPALKAARKALFDQMVAKAYEHGKALSIASHFEFDDVIDPAESRHWIIGALRSVPPPARSAGKKRPCVDTW